MKKTLITVGVVVAIAALLIVPKLDLFKSKKGPAADAPRGPGKMAVEAITVRPSRLDNKLIVTGSVQANESLELKSEVSGKIASITFSEGKTVKKGEVLVLIHDEETRAQLEKQKYNRKLNEEKDAISQEEYENALNRLNTTTADIKLLEAQLEKTRIKAPFEGRIGLRYVSEGSYISPSTVIATLYNINPAKIEFAVPGRYSTQVTAGKKIRFTIENDTTFFEGEVYAIEPRIDLETRTLRLRAVADNTSGRLLPGQFVKIDLILETLDDALLVPTEAVVPEQDGKKVFVLRNGKVAEVSITTGIRTEKSLEVLSGLQVGDTVLTTGILQLRSGMEVGISKMK
jgi:membrane fusion protein (multidrug efflux system)